MERTWNYFNGRQHGYNSSKGFKPPTPITRAYCASCAPTHIEGWTPANPPQDWGHEHHGTGFSCAPWRIGRPCDGCGKDI
jgi:hypothetical protein